MLLERIAHGAADVLARDAPRLIAGKAGAQKAEVIRRRVEFDAECAKAVEGGGNHDDEEAVSTEAETFFREKDRKKKRFCMPGVFPDDSPPRSPELRSRERNSMTWKLRFWSPSNGNQRAPALPRRGDTAL